MTRRRFGALLACGLAGTAGLRRIGRWLCGTRLARAARSKVFPGRLRPLDELDVNGPSRWAG